MLGQHRDGFLRACRLVAVAVLLGQMFPPLQRVQLVERMRIVAPHRVPAENSHAFDDTVLAFVAKHPNP